MPVSKSRFDRRHEELELIVQRILVENGVSGLSIERIAAESGYSRPTVYQHFAGKTEAILAVAKRCLDRIDDLVTRAADVEGSARDRALGLIVAYELMARFHPNNFYISEFLSFPWVRKQLPADLTQTHAALIERYFGQFVTLLVEAKQNGELSLPESTTAEQATFQTLATAQGIYAAIIKGRYIFTLSRSGDPWRDARNAVNTLWDGLGWKPLSRPPSDYETVYEHILKTAFPDYWIKSKTEALTREVALG